jgi:hypothetical protein
MTDGFEMTLSREAVFQGMELAKDVDEADSYGGNGDHREE